MGNLSLIDIVLIVVIAAVCIGIIVRGIRRRKRGETGCSCGCGSASCPGCEKKSLK